MALDRFVVRQLHNPSSLVGRLALCFTARESLEKRGFAQHDAHACETHEVIDMLATCGFLNLRAESGQDRHREFVCLSGDK